MAWRQHPSDAVPVIKVDLPAHGNPVPEALRALVTLTRQTLAAMRAGVTIQPTAAPSALVSIVIPTLCAGPHVHRIYALERLLRRDLPAQSHTNYEALVISDGHNLDVAALVNALGDSRVRYAATEARTGFWGHPATRLGLDMARGDYFVRMNDDNRPYHDFLANLLSGFCDDVEVTYARVVFANEARRFWAPYFADRWSYILPSDHMDHLHSDNIDCMNVMVSIGAAKARADAWNDAIDADWRFLEAVLNGGAKCAFVDRLIGQKN